MAGSVNTNIGAVRASNALAKNERDMNTAMQRLSTGKRINTAQDDAAGLAIASKMTSQINSLDQAVRNAGDAISLVQSADGAMIEVTNMVQRMRELAIQAISDTNTKSDRDALNLEFQALSHEVSRIGGNTQWNGGNILDGLSGVNGTSTFHIGANANQVITATMPTIGSVEGDFTAATTKVAGATVSEVAGVAAVYTTTADLANSNFGTGNLVISDGTNSMTIDVSTGSTGDTLAKVKTLIASGGANQASSASHAALAFTVSFDSDKLKFTYDDVGAVSTQPTITINGSSIALTNTTAGVDYVAASTAAPQKSLMTLSSTFGTLRDGDTITYTVDGKAASATVVSTQNADKSFTMTGLKDIVNVSGTTAGTVSLAFKTATTLELTGTNNNEAFVIDNIQVTRGIAADVGKTDISTFQTATSALSILDTAVASVNMKRAELGAVANRLEYAADNMANISMNARQSRSRVEDADYASETTELARTQIIQQAGTAMLAQANQSTQSVLKLLQ